MNWHQIFLIVVIIALTLLSGIADAQGFIHASTAWMNGKVIWEECLKSLLGFAVGAICYILVTNYLRQAGVVSAEMQTIIWFTVTIIGVALFNGKILHWQIADQIVAFAVLCGVAWLLMRTGG